MRTVLLCVCATLLLTATVVPDPSANGQQRWDAKGPRYSSGGDSTAGAGCALKLKPSGQCGGGGGSGAGAAGGEAAAGAECPYQLTLPPLTIQLPKQFRLLEKTLKELQSLKETVNKLKSNCLECQGGGGSRGTGAEAGGFVPQADEGQVSFPEGDSGGGTGTGGAAGAGERRVEQQATGASREEVVVVVRGDGMVTGSAGNGLGSGQGSSRTPLYPNSMQEMQVKINRMSASLRHARTQISTLQSSLDGKLVNMEKVQAMVDTKVENITGVVNKLSSTCHKECPQQQSPQFILAPRDCSDYNVLDQRKNGVYNVTPDHRNGTFQVFCDMESFGGGWTVVQQRLNGSVSFNRTWAEYKKGFGDFRGEFWLGNDHIHLLTKSKDMILRIELEDFEGVREYAKYDQFYVANEFLRYRLSISGYSGTAGNAISFNKHFNHDQQFFTTPDRDNDKYPSGNCGAYYSSGWWFDACMSANLNGKYYHKRYKGVRNGIFWGTWHNMSTEYYPTNYRQAFKTVKMMMRPKNYAP